MDRGEGQGVERKRSRGELKVQSDGWPMML